MLLTHYGNVGHFILCKYKTCLLQEWKFLFFLAKGSFFCCCFLLCGCFLFNNIHLCLIKKTAYLKTIIKKHHF